MSRVQVLSTWQDQGVADTQRQELMAGAAL
jgi:hypothetical protein